MQVACMETESSDSGLILTSSFGNRCVIDQDSGGGLGISCLGDRTRIRSSKSECEVVRRLVAMMIRGT